MSTTPRTTPRTDAELIRTPSLTYLARTLETELAAERAIVSRIWVQLGSPTYADLNGRSIYDLIDEIKTELAADREKVRVLRGAMTRLQGYCEWVIPPDDRICAIARAALAMTEASQ
jgi:hypothetical protein